jgi:hypothetical protein
MALTPRHRTAAVTAATGALLIIGGLGWLFGPWALVGFGAVLVALGLFVIDVDRST